MSRSEDAPHRFLKKPPKRLAVVDQRGCTGCAGSPVCVSFCETVTVKDQAVDAIRVVEAPDNPFEVAYVEFDRCIGCGLCAQVCPWEAITMYRYDEAQQARQSTTLQHFEPLRRLRRDVAIQRKASV